MILWNPLKVKIISEIILLSDIFITVLQKINDSKLLLPLDCMRFTAKKFLSKLLIK